MRDEVMAHIFDPGDPVPKRTLTFLIDVTDEGHRKGTPFRVRRTFDHWRRIGSLVFDNAVVSYNGDAVIHFQHPTWRSDRNDPATATRVDRTRRSDSRDRLSVQCCSHPLYKVFVNNLFNGSTDDEAHRDDGNSRGIRGRGARGAAPAGWKQRLDRSTSASDPDAAGAVKFVTMGNGSTRRTRRRPSTGTLRTPRRGITP